MTRQLLPVGAALMFVGFFAGGGPALAAAQAPEALTGRVSSAGEGACPDHSETQLPHGSVRSVSAVATLPLTGSYTAATRWFASPLRVSLVSNLMKLPGLAG